MKIYKVEVTYQVVIRAESQQAAERKADYIVRREDDGEPMTVTSSEVETVADLEKPWDGDCRPWGERDDMDRTIGQILANAADVGRADDAGPASAKLTSNH